MTVPTPTAATPEELAARMRSYADNPAACYVPIHQVTLTEWARWIEAQAQHSEAQRAEIERLRVMADEPTTKRVWDGIQAMAGLFADPDHMPTVLEFKAAFDAAFVVDGKPYDVERIKAEWQADYAGMEAALAAVTAERDRMREALTVACKWGIAAPCWDGAVAAGLRDWIAAGCTGPFLADMLKTLAIIDPDLRAALSAKEATDGPMSADLLERARAAVTVEEECDVIAAALPEMWPGKLNRLEDLTNVVNGVRLGFLPRAVLLGVVAALVPEGMGWGVNGPFTHADGATHWEAYCRTLDWLSGSTPALALLIAILEASNHG